MRAPHLLLTVLIIAVAAGCVSTVDGTPSPAGSHYTPPADGSGYGQQIDQPLPLPVTKLDASGCDWTEDALPALAPLNLKYANGTGSGCQFGAGNTSHEIIQVHLAGPYTELNQATAMLEPVTVAGIPGRLYVYEPVEDPTFCSVALDVRAYSDLTVDAFDHKDFAPSAPDNRANCELATKAAEILVRKYVPEAGGTPYPDTKQKPDDETLRALAPCDFVRSPIYTPVIADDPEVEETDFGTACTYADGNGSLRELATDGKGGLDDLPNQLRDSQTTSITFGELPARKEYNDTGCLLAVETGDGRVLGVEYSQDDPVDDACQLASVVLAAAIVELL